MRYSVIWRLAWAVAALGPLPATPQAAAIERKPTLRTVVRELADEADKAVKEEFNWPVDSAAVEKMAEVKPERREVLRMLGSRRLDSNPAVDGYIRFHLLSKLPGEPRLTDREADSLLRNLPAHLPFTGLTAAQQAQLQRYVGQVLNASEQAAVGKYIEVFTANAKQSRTANFYVDKYYEQLEKTLAGTPGMDLLLLVEKCHGLCQAGDPEAHKVSREIEKKVMEIAFDKKVTGSVRGKLIARINALQRYPRRAVPGQYQINAQNNLNIRQEWIGVTEEQVDKLTTLLMGRKWEPKKK